MILPYSGAFLLLFFQRLYVLEVGVIKGVLLSCALRCCAVMEMAKKSSVILRKGVEGVKKNKNNPARS